ncbi:hypothetical protein [Paenibacillus sp. 481]|uniref:hypothetical protein n=1 Tax=Paenibacillus sp. 481 TaxID=2835869 RepID=UPI001E3B82DB|nr:hypothetical protein [Paenibacillus sp. 481]UHA73811.1 hypothetical protein KIK04_01165 [Paenibacillus sp. 481]
MSVQSRFRKCSKLVLCMAIAASIFPFRLDQVDAAATPSLNGYQSGNHVKLEWGVAMQPTSMPTPKPNQYLISTSKPKSKPDLTSMLKPKLEPTSTQAS